MGFNNINMVDYYSERYDISYKAVISAIAEPNPDLNKVKMLIRRCRNDKAALDLNVGLRDRNVK